MEYQKEAFNILSCLMGNHFDIQLIKLFYYNPKESFLQCLSDPLLHISGHCKAIKLSLIA